MSASQNEERLAAIAYILDRVEQLPASSTTRTFATELVSGLAEGRHIDCDRAGEYDDLHPHVSRIMRSHADITPLVRRPKLKLVR